MRTVLFVGIGLALAACEAEPAQPEKPRKSPDIKAMTAEAERRELLSALAGPGDYKVNFGEPFIQFENRGTRMAISQSYNGPSYRVIDVVRREGQGSTVFHANEGAVPGSQPFVLTIAEGLCTNEFSLERTGFIAWLGNENNPMQARGCAAPAK